MGGLTAIPSGRIFRRFSLSSIHSWANGRPLSCGSPESRTHFPEMWVSRGFWLAGTLITPEAARVRCLRFSTPAVRRARKYGVHFSISLFDTLCVCVSVDLWPGTLGTSQWRSSSARCVQQYSVASSRFYMGTPNERSSKASNLLSV